MFTTEKKKSRPASASTTTKKAAPNGKLTDSTPSRGKTTREAPNQKEMAISLQERQQLIAKAAYFRAQQRNFAPGGELDDWLQSESEVNRLLLGKQTAGVSTGNQASATQTTAGQSPRKRV
jgi:hypothetical protein